MGVEKQYSQEESAAVNVSTPQAVGYSVADAAARLEKKGLTYRTVGTGDVVTAQVPAAGAAVPGGSAGDPLSGRSPAGGDRDSAQHRGTEL